MRLLFFLPWRGLPQGMCMSYYLSSLHVLYFSKTLLWFDVIDITLHLLITNYLFSVSITDHKIHSIRAYSSVCFSTFAELFNHHHSLRLEHFLMSKETPYILAVTVYCPFPTLRQSLIYFFISINWPIQHMCYKWNHKYVIICEYLFSLSMNFLAFICPRWSMCR